VILLCPSPDSAEALSDDARLTSDDVWCLSVPYIGPKSRRERPGKTKIGTEVAHVTRDSDTTFKVKWSKVNLQGAGHIMAASRTACYILCDITLSVLIYSAGRYLFREFCQPWHSVHHSLPPVRKCSNATDPYELPDFWLPNSPDQNIFHYKIWGSESTRKKHRMWTIWGGIWLMYVFEWNRALLCPGCPRP